MIVKCDKCQTRFKIPDEKVSESGTRVRCARCQNTFRVSRPTSNVANVAVDPFAQFAAPRVEAPPPPSDFDSPFSVPAGVAPVNNGVAAAAAIAAPSTRLLGDIPDFQTPFQTPVPRSAPTPAHAIPSPPPQTARAIDPPAPSAESSSSSEAPRRAEPATAPRVAPSAARRGVGLVVNLLVASALLAVLLWVGTVYLHEGKFELSSLSWQSFKALFAGPGELLAVDVSNGLYETSGGKHVFYVRGEVENRGSSVKRARVSVEILDGSLPLTRADVLAGASPNAEELYGLSSTADLVALHAQLEKAAAEVSPGGRVPFLIAFYEYPPDLSQYRLRVTVRDARDDAQ
jgi:predicted Zn finger-like uncharacterized protein